MDMFYSTGLRAQGWLPPYLPFLLTFPLPARSFQSCPTWKLCSNQSDSISHSPAGAVRLLNRKWHSTHWPD